MSSRAKARAPLGKVAEKSRKRWSASSLASAQQESVRWFGRGKITRERERERTTTLENRVHLLGPVLIQHLIGLVNDRVLDTAHGQDVGVAHEVNQATGSGDEDVTALAQILDLLAHWVAAVSSAWTQHALVTHLARLVEDLDRQLAGGNDDQDQGLGADAVTAVVVGGQCGAVGWTWAAQLLRLTHELAQDRDEVRSSLTGACEDYVSDRI